MIRITLNRSGWDLLPELDSFAGAWNLTRLETPEGYLLLPEYMQAIHGLTVESHPASWTFSREADATTWEDFLLMHITHTLAGKYGLLLQYETVKGIRLAEPAPGDFATFDAYAERVVSKEQGIVRDMKKNWIYSHRTRYIH